MGGDPWDRDSGLHCDLRQVAGRSSVSWATSQAKKLTLRRDKREETTGGPNLNNVEVQASCSCSIDDASRAMSSAKQRSRMIVWTTAEVQGNLVPWKADAS